MFCIWNFKLAFFHELLAYLTFQKKHSCLSMPTRFSFQTPPISHATSFATTFPVLPRSSGSWISCKKVKMAAVASDAATMLAEALEKMDGLISDDQLIMESFKSQPRPFSMDEKVLSLVEELRAQVEQLSNDAKSIDVPESSIIFLIDWLMSVQVNKLKYLNCS